MPEGYHENHVVAIITLENTTTTTLGHINEKLDWAIRSLERIDSSQDDQLQIQDNFWSFLTAFQQGWFYFNKWIALQFPEMAQKERRTIAVSHIENWKNAQLNEEERNAWDILQELRNDDTHRAPVLPKVFKADVSFRGRLVTFQGHRVIFKEYQVEHKGKSHSIKNLSEYGINAIKKLIFHIPSIKEQ